MNKKKFLILGTSAFSLINFRKEFMLSVMKRMDVIAASSMDGDKVTMRLLQDIGVEYRPITLQRNGFNVIHDIKTFFDLRHLLNVQKIDTVFAYGVKLVIWGGLSSRLKGVPFFALITGLGYSFQGESVQRRILTALVVFLYRVALRKSKFVFFQNKDNQDVFIKYGIIPLHKTCVVNGSGVNTNKFELFKLPGVKISFLCVARLLGEKGLREYAAAASIVKREYPDVSFSLVGPVDASPDSISLEEVLRWKEYVDYKGPTNNVKEFIKSCHIYVLPSYHEGLPRSTLEAMSMGRAVITTTAAGCKETVIDGVNGFTVPIKSIDKLVEKMTWFIENRDKIKTMGIESRKMVEDKFDVHKVNNKILDVMGFYEN